MSNEVINVNQGEMLQAINRSEIDMQIATAHEFPRDIKQSQKNILAMATIDEDTAEDCFYVLHRNGGNSGGDNAIEGLSVRFAEIVADCWGNLRVAARIIGNDGKTITAQGVCHDLETNVAISVEVKRRITNKYGQTFSEDMQVVTGNAACAIAFRNAVLKVVPKAITKSIVKEVKKMALGASMDLQTTRQKMLEYFQKLGVTTDMVLIFLQRDSVEAINSEDVFTLRGVANAIKEGTTTIDEQFKKPAATKTAALQVKAQAISAAQKAASAVARQHNSASGKKPAATASEETKPKK